MSLFTTWMLWCNKADVERWNTRWARRTVPLEVVTVTDANMGRAMVALPRATDPDTILVAFRGVNENAQWFQTAKFWTSDFYGHSVHDGFNDNYRALAPGVTLGVRRAMQRCPQCKKVHITGYSMGGALATLALVDLHKKFPSLCGSIITFGSPRVGKGSFATELFPKAVCGTSRRIVHKGDMVVFLPPRWTGYRHVAFEFWNPGTSPATEKTVIQSCDKSKYYGDNDRCSNEYGKGSISDHSKYLGLYFKKNDGCELHREINDPILSQFGTGERVLTNNDVRSTA